MKTTYLTALLACALALPAEAANYYVVVPMPGRTTAMPTPAEPEAPPPPPVARGELLANYDTSFGVVALGGTTSRLFTFQNVGTADATNVAVRIPTWDGLTLSHNTCGSEGSPVSVAAGGSCTLNLNYGGSEAGSLGGAWVSVEGDFVGTPQTLSLTGTLGGFDAQGAWSSSYNSLVAPTTALTDFATLSVGRTMDRDIRLWNAGTVGRMAAGYRLAGDVSQFELVSVQKQSASAPYYYKANCGAAVAADKLSSTTCTADDRATPASSAVYHHMNVKLRYKPTVIGAHSVTLTPVTANGTALPEPLVFTGAGQFNPQGEWSGSFASTVAAPSSFGLVTPGRTLDREVYLRNIGTHGPLAVGITLSGDTSQFELVSVLKSLTYNSYVSGCGASLDAAKLSSSPCLADDPSAGGTYQHILVRLRYKPTSVGEHRIALTPVSSNGTALPAPWVLTGSGVFNASGAWSSRSDSNTGLTTLALGAKAVGTNNLQSVFLRNTGTNGAMVTKFTLSGDVSQFELANGAAKASTSGNTSGCGSAPAADLDSNSPCTADDMSAGGYPHIYLAFRYKPTAPGSHRIFITPTSTNGAGVPAPLEVTGTGY